jgi:hypothetical protein
MGAETCATTHHYKALFNPVIKACGQFMLFLNEGNVYRREIMSFKEENIYIFIYFIRCNRMLKYNITGMFTFSPW